MNESLRTADAPMHRKIVVLSLMASTLVVALASASHDTRPDITVAGRRSLGQLAIAPATPASFPVAASRHSDGYASRPVLPSTLKSEAEGGTK
jgi:hypothetical protein